MKAKLELNGLGGELVLKAISEEAYEYWINQPDSKLSDYIIGEKVEDVPLSASFAVDEFGEHLSWYDLDDLGHYYGPHPSHCSLSVYVDHEESDDFRLVLDDSFKRAVSKAKGKVRNGRRLRQLDKTTPAIQIYSVEKGCLFESEINLKSREDFRDLVFYVTSFHGEALITKVEYQGGIIDNIGGDTTGKGIYAELCRV